MADPMLRRNAFSVVAHHALTRPDALALSGNGRRFTYRELADHAERVAGALSSMCPQRGSRVAVVANNHALTCLVYLAAGRAGLVVSLVNALVKASELSFVFAKLDPQLVIFDSSHREVVRAAIETAKVRPLLGSLEAHDEGTIGSVEEWAASTITFAGAAPDDDDCSEISWTSGTTSTPKGVMLTHATALYRAEREAALFRLTSADTAAVITPLFHQSGIRDTVLVMWVCGGHAVILPRFDLPTFWADMVRHRVTHLCMVETILLMLERNPPCEAEQENTIRTVLAAGAPDVIRRCESRFGFRVVQVWGMTETGVAAGVPLSLSIDEVHALRDWGKGAFLAGWPASEDTRLRLVAHGEIVSGAGASGEIQISSRLLFSGYYQDAQATAAAFDGAWMKTGDLGMYGPGGALYFVDRLKDVIRRGGENIASKQVEEVLLAHPQVRHAAVVPVPDPLFMQEVKAVVVVDGEAPAEELWSWCEARLARYKVPRYIEFRKALPVNGSGRVQKQVLVSDVPGDAVVFDRRAARIAS